MSAAGGRLGEGALLAVLHLGGDKSISAERMVRASVPG